MEIFVRTQTTRLKQQPVPGPRLGPLAAFPPVQGSPGGRGSQQFRREKKGQRLQGLTMALVKWNRGNSNRDPHSVLLSCPHQATLFQFQ